MSRKCSVIEFTRRGFFCVKTDGTTVPALSFRLPGRPLNKTPTRKSFYPVQKFFLLISSLPNLFCASCYTNDFPSIRPPLIIVDSGLAVVMHICMFLIFKPFMSFNLKHFFLG